VEAPDNTGAAAVADGDVLLMNLIDGTTTRLAVGDAYNAALTADRLLVSRAGGPLEIRDRSTHAVVASVPGGAPAGGLVTSPDGSLAARLRRDGTVEVVDIARAGVLGVLGEPSQILYGFRPGLAFTPDSSALLVAGPDPNGAWGSGTLDVYDLAPHRLVQVACATAGRDLSPDEWRQFVNDAVPGDLRCTR
jgi:hypothetical protein